MKSLFVVIFSVLFMAQAISAFSQIDGREEEIPLPDIELVFGPRVGVTGIIMDSAKFDEQMQVGFPRNVEYIPVFTEFGFSAKQLVSMGSSGSNLIVEETFLLAGLDQNFAIPAVRLVFGIEGRIGMEFKVGPYLSFKDNNGKVGINGSFVYMLGWTIKSQGMIIPIELAMVPLPSYWNPRLTLTTGLSFKIPD